MSTSSDETPSRPDGRETSSSGPSDREASLSTNGNSNREGDGPTRERLQTLIERLERATKGVEETWKTHQEQIRRIGDRHAQTLSDIRDTETTALTQELEAIADDLEGEVQTTHADLQSALNDDIRKPLREEAQNLKGTSKQIEEEMIQRISGQIDLMEEVMRHAAESLSEVAREVIAATEAMAENGRNRHERMARTVTELKEATERFEQATEGIQEQKREIREHVDKAENAAEIIHGASLKESVEQLESVTNEGIDEMMETIKRIEEQTVRRIEKRHDTIINELDEARKRLSHQMTTTVERSQEILTENRAIQTVVRDYEDKLENEMEKMRQETKMITWRRALIILGAAMLGSLLSVLALGHLGYV